MQPHDPTVHRFRALDSWRGICALLVALHHIEFHGALYWTPLLRNAWLFVDFFFVLSGFVITHAYGDELAAASLKPFVIRRFGRLWPLHAAVLVAFVGLECVRLLTWHAIATPGLAPPFTDGRSLMAIVTNLLLIHALGVHHSLTWNDPSWSISTEFYTYLIFALVCVKVVGRSMRIAVSLVLAAAGVAILAFVSRDGIRETFDWGIARCVYGFFLGSLTYEIWRRIPSPRPNGTALEVAVVALVIAFVCYAPSHRALEFLAPPLFAAAVLIFAEERGALSRLLLARPAAALGSWSYSIYMVHALVLALLFSALHLGGLMFHANWLGNGTAIDLGSPTATGAIVLFYVAATVALSAATWRLIERPGQRLFGRLARPKPAEISAQTT